MRERNIKGMPKTTCSKCGGALEENRVGKQRYCKKCHAGNMREKRPIHSELSTDAKKRANARAYLNTYLRRGKVQKKPCIICGSEDSQAHHQDYNKPLDVIWLCREHHLLVHEIYK